MTKTWWVVKFIRKRTKAYAVAVGTTSFAIHLRVVWLVKSTSHVGRDRHGKNLKILVMIYVQFKDQVEKFHFQGMSIVKTLKIMLRITLITD